MTLSNLLKQPPKRKPTDSERSLMNALAGNWPTCACGQLCAGIPKNADGRPFNGVLADYGDQFFRFVLDGKWRRAVAVMKLIEEETENYLAELKSKTKRKK